MTITIDMSQALDVPCDLCSWLDDSGSIRLVDDQRVTKFCCRQCTFDLVRACLPNGRFASYETNAPATANLALAEA